jgi:hypothetical protein
VHSNVQIIASVESGGNGALQFSQVGRSSSMAFSRFALTRGGHPLLRPGSSLAFAANLSGVLPQASPV